MSDIVALEERINALKENLTKITDDTVKVKKDMASIIFNDKVLAAVNDEIANYTAKIKELDDKVGAKTEEINALDDQIKQTKLDLESQVVSLNCEKQTIIKQERIDYLNAFIDSTPEESAKYTREILKAKLEAMVLWHDILR